jgi:hypothetical protein
MAKYRIISRFSESTRAPRYYAQHKLFNLFWVDMERNHFDLRDGMESMSVSHRLHEVERYIEDLMNGRQKDDMSPKVVKIYE